MGFTNASSNTFPPTTLQPLYRIWRDWCIGDSLGYMNDNFLYLETLVNNLSASITSNPAVAKAWVSFDGTISTPTIHSSFNISSVQKVAYGYYDITFSTPMLSLNYLVVGGCGATPSSSSGPASSECNVYVIDSNHYTNPFARTTSTFRIMTKGESGTLNESYRTDVVVFGS